MNPFLTRYTVAMDRIDRAIQRNEEALQSARKKREQYVRTLETTGAEAAEARKKLRKAGYLPSN